MILPGLGDRIRSAIRIWDKSRTRPIGSGFLVDRQHVFTCAHVVGEAVDQRQALIALTNLPPNLAVTIDFVSHPVAQGGQFFTAKPVAEAWRAEGGKTVPADVAVLKLDQGTPLPKDSCPVVACPETLPGDRFQAYGIKEDLLDGTYVQGEFVGQVTLDRVEVVADRVDQAIRAGCSGAGVWNCRRYGLAGMIVEMQNETQGRVIPVETLQLVWPITGQTVTGKEAASAGSSRLDFSLLARRLSSLLYTFDRELQEADFDMALETSWKQQRPVVCAILGIADDLPILCRDRCLRVRLRDLLERLELGGRLPNLKHIRWPGRKAPNALARLQQQVKIELRAADSSAGKIRKAYNDGVVPFVFHSDIRNLDFDLSDGDVLVQWIKFWDEVGSEPLNKPLAVFLLLELDGQTQQRVGLTPYFVDNFFAVPQSNAHALNRLNAFSREAVVDWLREKANELALSDDDFALSLLPKVRIGLDAMDLRLAVLEKWITTTLADATVP